MTDHDPLMFVVAAEIVFHFPPTLLCNLIVTPTCAGEIFPVNLKSAGFMELVGQLTFVMEVKTFAVALVDPATVVIPEVIAEM